MEIHPDFGGEKTKPIKANFEDIVATEGTEDTEENDRMYYLKFRNGICKTKPILKWSIWRKLLIRKGLWKYTPISGAKKQSQFKANFKTHRPSGRSRRSQMSAGSHDASRM